MPKDVSLKIQDKDGNMRAIVHAQFPDDELSLLQRFVQFSDEVRDTPLIAANQKVSFSMNFNFETQESSHDVSLPPKSVVQALLHVMRPFVLQKEPTSFYKVCNILKRRLDEPISRQAIDRQKARFSGEEFQDQMKIFWTSPETQTVVLNSEEMFLIWLNAHEYHRDEDKAAVIAELNTMLPFEVLRALFISMMQDRAWAVLNIANLARFILSHEPGGNRRVRIQ